jgi:outer membrane protein TolC
MTRGWHRALPLPAVLLLLAPAAGAQERVTLDEAIARGLQHSARIAELQAREAGAAAAEQGRKAASLPVVAGMAGYTRTNHVQEFFLVNPPLPRVLIYPDAPDNFRTRIDLQWPIYTGGRFDALERAARAERGAAVEEIETARADRASRSRARSGRCSPPARANRSSSARSGTSMRMCRTSGSGSSRD